MAKSIISEGKTTNEAIENGLKKLKVSKEKVDVKVLEDEEKRSFFSILTPRVVKVELTVKENASSTEKKTVPLGESQKNGHTTEHIEKPEIKASEEDLKKAKQNIEEFLKEFTSKLSEKAEYNVDIKENLIEVNVDGDNIGFLIGYRGDTLYAFQNVMSAVANRDTQNRVRVSLDIAGYKQRRIKTLEDLAEKISKTVIRTKKSVTLEPMQPYERKIIHAKLQENDKVTTRSIGEEPRRKVVISLIK